MLAYQALQLCRLLGSKEHQVRVRVHGTTAERDEIIGCERRLFPLLWSMGEGHALIHSTQFKEVSRVVLLYVIEPAQRIIAVQGIAEPERMSDVRCRERHVRLRRVRRHLCNRHVTKRTVSRHQRAPLITKAEERDKISGLFMPCSGKNIHDETVKIGFVLETEANHLRRITVPHAATVFPRQKRPCASERTATIIIVLNAIDRWNSLRTLRCARSACGGKHTCCLASRRGQSHCTNLPP